MTSFGQTLWIENGKCTALEAHFRQQNVIVCWPNMTICRNQMYFLHNLMWTSNSLDLTRRNLKCEAWKRCKVIVKLMNKLIVTIALYLSLRSHHKREKYFLYWFHLMQPPFYVSEQSKPTPRFKSKTMFNGESAVYPVCPRLCPTLNPSSLTWTIWQKHMVSGRLYIIKMPANKAYLQSQHVHPHSSQCPSGYLPSPCDQPTV